MSLFDSLRRAIFALYVFSECSSATSAKTVDNRLLLSPGSFLLPESIGCFNEFSDILDLGAYLFGTMSTLSENESLYVFYDIIPPPFVSKLETLEALDADYILLLPNLDLAYGTFISSSLTIISSSKLVTVTLESFL